MKNRLLFIFLFCAAAHAANGEKILRVTFQVAETGFDPVKVHDYYSGTVIEAVFDPLLTYDTWRGPRSSSPTPPSRCPRSRQTAAPTSSGFGGASISPTIR